MKERLFSVTKRDFDIQTFRAGGKGGQHQNTTDSGVRIVHRESGAVGESREHKSQTQNKRAALKRMAEHPKFKLFLSGKLQEIRTGLTLEERVNKAMEPENLLIEERGPGGAWRQVDPEKSEET